MTSESKQQEGQGQGQGMFGEFGGRYVSETLHPALEELTAAWARWSVDPEFRRELDEWLHEYVGRPSRLTYAERLTAHAGGAKIYLKREDLNHTGAHKINNCIGQVLLAKKLGKTRIIAETGAGQHGVATATVAARFGLPCEIYMGALDVERQRLNVERMRLLGATVHPVQSGSKTLKDAMNEALRDWVSNVATTHYIIGSVAGPHPYPSLVRDLQRVIGDEAKQQLAAKEGGRLPTACVACVGGGSNAMGLFTAFLDDRAVQLVGVEAAGDGIDSPRHAATISRGRPGVLHGSRSLVLCDDDGQVAEAHSISAGLDYPGVGPEHAHLAATGRVQYVAVTDDEALAALQLLGRTEGILCALETAHAVAYALPLAQRLGKDALVLICLSGRGDKDMPTVMQRLGGGV